MPEHPAARLVEQELAQGAVAGDEARLLPQRLARRGRDAADDHIADFALGVAGDNVDDLAAAHMSLFEREGRRLEHEASRWNWIPSLPSS